MRSAAPADETERLETFAGGLSGTNLERAGDHNQRVTLQAIRINGPITRSELTDIVGLTAPTIANITRRLLNDGLILEAGRQQGGRGQPAMRLAINPEGACSIGLNIDRDHLTLVALDFLGRVRARTTLEAHFALPDRAASFVRSRIGEMAATGAVDPARLAGVGVAMPDQLGGVNLPHRPEGYQVWDQTDVVALLADALPGDWGRPPVLIENDAAAAAIGELQFGHGLRMRSFVYLLVSAGLGGGLVIEGSYFRGARGRSGELGFLPVAGAGPETLQDIVSLSALYDHLAERGVEASTPGALDGLDPRGRAVADAWLDRSAEALCDPLLVLNCGIDPEAILIGGRLPGDLVAGLCDRLNQRLAARGATVPAIAPVRRAALAADAAAVGAAILPFSDRFLPTRNALMTTAEA